MGVALKKPSFWFTLVPILVPVVVCRTIFAASCMVKVVSIVGVVIVGEILKTTDPAVPVSSVIMDAKLAEDGVVRNV